MGGMAINLRGSMLQPALSAFGSRVAVYRVAPTQALRVLRRRLRGATDRRIETQLSNSLLNPFVFLVESSR